MTTAGFDSQRLASVSALVDRYVAEGKLAGAGVMVVNPPYTLEQDLLIVLPWLCDLFRQGEGAGWRLDGGLTPEYLAGGEA